MSASSTQPDTDLHRRLAAQLFNETWVLFDKSDRTADDDARRIHSAHASHYFPRTSRQTTSPRELRQ